MERTVHSDRPEGHRQNVRRRRYPRQLPVRQGGIGYLLEQTYGYNLPPKMREHFSYLCKDISDHEHKELKPDEVLNIFEENYLNLTNGVTVTDFEFMRDKDNVKIGITFAKDGEETEMEAEGNGSLNAINNALRAYTGAEYTLQVFTQHSMQGQGSAERGGFVHRP